MTPRSLVDGDIPLEGITRGESNLTSCPPPMFLSGFSEKEQRSDYTDCPTGAREAEQWGSPHPGGPHSH